MSYGFDPNELIETKIDLIDKDGFHGVGEASDGGNSGGGNSSGSFPNCGIYITKKIVGDNLNDDACAVFAISQVTGAKTPLRFFSIYFGDAISDSGFHIDGEMYSVYKADDQDEMIGYDFGTSELPYIIGDYIIARGYYSNADFSNVEPNLVPGTPVHAIFVCEDDDGHFFTVQAHDVVREIDGE